MSFEINLKKLTSETMSIEDNQFSMETGSCDITFEFKSIMSKKGYEFFRITNLKDFCRIQIHTTSIDFPSPWIVSSKKNFFLFSKEKDPHHFIPIIQKITKSDLNYILVLEINNDFLFVIIDEPQIQEDEILNLFKKCLFEKKLQEAA